MAQAQAKFNLRVKVPSGQQLTLRDQDATISLLQFKELLASKCSIQPGAQRLSAGYPPQEVSKPETDPINTIFKNGDSIVLEEIKDPSAAPPASSDFIVSDKPGRVVKRAMADDNSCLFHAVSYCLEKNSSNVATLRKIVADAVVADQLTYNEALLQKSPQAYATWIKQNNSWGGSVELQILSNHYKVQIMAYDVTRNRGNCFGEDQPFTQRMYLIYDGIHYDSLVWNPSNQQQQNQDVTLFSPTDLYMETGSVAFVAQEHKKGNFVDEYNYQLKCEQCGKMFKGNNEAVAHNKSTGHTAFTQAS